MADRSSYLDNSPFEPTVSATRSTNSSETERLAPGEGSLPFLNVSGYRFVDFEEDALPALREELLELCRNGNLRGTILLSPEGVNVMLCGLESDIRSVVRAFAAYPEISALWLKESRSSEMTFTRMLVKLKNQIIPVDDPLVRPAQRTGQYLPPETLKAWYEQERDFVVIDTRNHYEIELGCFSNAIDLGLSNFRSIRDRLELLDPSLRTKPIVTYCTGGVRCEKVTAMMLDMGFADVYQLEGGIINYFERCGGDHFNGECFVFDKRVAIDERLNETPTTQCYICQHILTLSDQLSPEYTPGVCCPYCPSGQSSTD